MKLIKFLAAVLLIYAIDVFVPYGQVITALFMWACVWICITDK